MRRVPPLVRDGDRWVFASARGGSSVVLTAAGVELHDGGVRVASTRETQILREVAYPVSLPWDEVGALRVNYPSMVPGLASIYRLSVLFNQEPVDVGNRERAAIELEEFEADAWRDRRTWTATLGRPRVRWHHARALYAVFALIEPTVLGRLAADPEEFQALLDEALAVRGVTRRQVARQVNEVLRRRLLRWSIVNDVPVRFHPQRPMDGGSSPWDLPDPKGSW